jgi:hypothetical protein
LFLFIILDPGNRFLNFAWQDTKKGPIYDDEALGAAMAANWENKRQLLTVSK